MASFNSVLGSRWTKTAVFLLCLVPLFALAWWIYKVDLTGNPLEFITHYTGDWTIRFLMITLAVTPLRMLLNRPAISRYRRMLGLFAFFYACLHLTTYIVFDPHASFDGVVEDIAERPYITMGMAAFAAILPLAITSTAGWVRRLGFKRWQQLHRLIYFSALAGVIHYYWLVKSDVRSPLRYAGIFVVLMLFRTVVWARKPKSAKQPQPAMTKERTPTAPSPGS